MPLLPAPQQVIAIETARWLSSNEAGSRADNDLKESEVSGALDQLLSMVSGAVGFLRKTLAQLSTSTPSNRKKDADEIEDDAAETDSDDEEDEEDAGSYRTDDYEDENEDDEA